MRFFMRILSLCVTSFLALRGVVVFSSPHRWFASKRSVRCVGLVNTQEVAMFRLLFVLFTLFALTVSQDVPELEPFDPNAFEAAFARLEGKDDDEDDEDEDGKASA